MTKMTVEYILIVKFPKVNINYTKYRSNCRKVDDR